MADKIIKVKVDVESNVEPTIAGLKKLKQELKELSFTDPKFKEKEQEINDYADALKAAKTGAGNFAEVLGQLPGPIGDIGNKVGGAVNTLKQFGALKLTDIKSSFVELGKDLGDAAKGLGKLTGITKIYTVINGALAKSFTAVGIAEGTAAAGARVFAGALVATGIGAIVVVVGLLVDKLIKLGNEYFNQGERIKDVSENLKTQAAEGSKVFSALSERRIAEAKAEGKSEEELYDLKITLLREERAELFAQQEVQDRLQAAEIKTAGNNKEKLKEINDRYNKETNAKSIRQLQIDTAFLNLEVEENAKAAAKKKAIDDKEEQNRLKIQAKREADLQKITENEKAATLSLLDEREQQKRKIVNDYNAQIKLAADNGKETFILEEAKLKALRELRDKFKKEDDDKQKEIDDKKKEDDKKKNEDDIASRVQEYENQISALDAKNELIDNDFQEDLARLETKKEILANEKALELSNTELTLKERNEIIGRYADKERDVERSITETKKAELQARTDLQMQYADYLQQFGNLLGQVAGENKSLAIAAIIIEQGAALAKVLIQASAANMAATAMAVSDPLNLVPGGSIIVAAKLARAKLMTGIQTGLSIAGIVAGAAKGISAINSAKVPGGGGGGTAAAGGGSSMSSPTAPVVAGTTAPQIQVEGGMNPSAQIAQTLTNAQKPLRAYVISGEISSAQALDRRTSRAATFSGG